MGYFYTLLFIFIIVFILSATIVPTVTPNVYPQVTKDDLRLNSLNHPFIPTFFPLLFKNIIASLLIISCGIFGYSFIPSLVMIINAFYIGENIAMLNRPDTFGAIYSFIPHAGIEIFGIILCTSFACNFAYEMQKLTYNKGFIGIISYKGDTWPTIKNHCIIPYVKYIIPILVISTFIECTISIYILKAIFNGV